MAIAKKRVQNKKKIIETTFEPISDDDKILGKEPEKKQFVKTNYEAADRVYKITNLRVGNKPVIVSGNHVETFIGSNNKAARILLKQGTEKVVTKDYDGNDEYIIEVVK